MGRGKVLAVQCYSWDRGDCGRRGMSAGSSSSSSSSFSGGSVHVARDLVSQAQDLWSETVGCLIDDLEQRSGGVTGGRRKGGIQRRSRNRGPDLEGKPGEKRRGNPLEHGPGREHVKQTGTWS